ncbi:MAG TPA: ATP-binding cassette domain-containing protein [Solirubrobacteraceae bacterium]|jgi:putative ABC transport system ATP-binding protein
MTLLSLTQVTRRYGDGRREVAVLDRVCMEVDAGDFVGVWGPRRSGKTTLLRVAAGIEAPNAGAVCFDGHVLTSMGANERARLLRAHGIAHVSGDWRPQLSQPAVDSVAMPLLGDRISLREARPLARRALEKVGAGECADVWTGRLSQGERIRVALARAIVREPRLLLIDEPAVSPSPLECGELYALLRSLANDSKLAVLVASEDLEALAGARRSMSISNGELRSMDPAGVVLAFPDRRAVRAEPSA